MSSGTMARKLALPAIATGNKTGIQSPSTYTHMHKDPLSLGVLLVVFVAVYILIFKLFCLLGGELPPTASPPPTLLSNSPSIELIEAQRVTSMIQVSRGADQAAAQTVEPSGNIGYKLNLNRAVIDILAMPTDSWGAKASSTNRGRTSGVQSSYNCAESPDVHGSLTSPKDCGADEAIARPTPPIDSVAPRGAAPSLVQLETPPFPATSPNNFSSKSPRDDVCPSSLYTAEQDQDIPIRSSICVPPPRQASLDGSSCVFLQHAVAWFILVVAVAVDGLKDPRLDLLFLQTVFEVPKSANVHFGRLSNQEATRKRIQDEFRLLYYRAQQSSIQSRLLVYLTGMGDGSGRMRLFGQDVIGEQDLGVWLADLRTKSPRSWPVVSVALNICRETVEPPNVSKHNLGLVWSCSAGQLAYAIGLGEGLPSSCFLISLFLACHDVLVGSCTFADAFRFRMNQLGQLLEFIHRKRHEGSKACAGCQTGEKCPPPGLQVPEWEQAGLDALANLGALILSECSDSAQIFNTLSGNMERWGFLKPDEETSPALFGLQPGLYGHMRPRAHQPRGASKPTWQATGPSIVS